MTSPIKTALQLFVDFSWLWLLHVAYVVRGRSHFAASVVKGFKYLFGRAKHPDSVMRDWLILMDLIVAFISVLLMWSASVEGP